MNGRHIYSGKSGDKVESKVRIRGKVGSKANVESGIESDSSCLLNRLTEPLNTSF